MANKRKSSEIPQGDDEQTKVLKNNLCTYFRRQASGFYKNTTDEERAQIKDAQQKYKAMSNAEKTDFAKAFQANKHSKSFQWMKEFVDTLQTKKNTSDSALEKYMTRSFAIKGCMRDTLLSVGAFPTIIIWRMPPSIYGGSPHNYGG